ncbi:MAG: hypothetical protein OQL08_09915 [Gammaproteobacteria bacterium]|nr:hypothetical protein [Gammaproteobacteria bacterium]
MTALHAAVATAAVPHTSLSPQLTLYHTLQQRLAQPGEISPEGLAGLQLLLAQLYCEMGMLQAAERPLDELQGGPSVRQLGDMGRLLLARQYRQRGEWAAATLQLSAIGGQLDTTLEHEHQQMLALSALERGAVDEALRRYGQVQGGEGAVLLARLNYAVLLLRGGRVEHGLILLQEIAGHTEATPAVSALRDRANLLLGYHLLQRQEHWEARNFLQRVRLSGPYSRDALLALGWTELALRGAEYAMVPWLELLAEGREDSLAEEAELAIAAAIASKGPSQRVIEHYQRLLVRFEQGRQTVATQRQRHVRPYTPEVIAAVLTDEPDPLARHSVAGVALAHLLALRQQWRSAEGESGLTGLDEGAFFERLWPLLRAVYAEPDALTGTGVDALVAQRTEAFIRNTLQTSSRSPHPATDPAARINADLATLDGEIATVAEWYRRSRLAALQARDERLTAYMERARLAIARNHDLALRRQERD